jgi:hypothetical protein
MLLVHIILHLNYQVLDYGFSTLAISVLLVRMDSTGLVMLVILMLIYHKTYRLHFLLVSMLLLMAQEEAGFLFVVSKIKFQTFWPYVRKKIREQIIRGFSGFPVGRLDYRGTFKYVAYNGYFWIGTLEGLNKTDWYCYL